LSFVGPAWAEAPRKAIEDAPAQAAWHGGLQPAAPSRLSNLSPHYAARSGNCCALAATGRPPDPRGFRCQCTAFNRLPPGLYHAAPSEKQPASCAYTRPPVNGNRAWPEKTPIPLTLTLLT